MYVSWIEMNEEQRAKARSLLPKWKPDDFWGFSFWVSADGKPPHLTSYRQMRGEDLHQVRSKGDLQDYTTAKFSLDRS